MLFSKVWKFIGGLAYFQGLVILMGRQSEPRINRLEAGYSVQRSVVQYDFEAVQVPRDEIL